MTRTARLAATAALASLLAACGSGSDDAAPSTAPAPAASDMATASASPTPDVTITPKPLGPAPVLPAAAKVDGKAGAEAFLRWYFDSVAYTAQQPSTKLPAIFTKDCKQCEFQQKYFTSLAEKKERFADRPFTTGTVSAAKEGSEWVVSATSNDAAARIIDAKGKVLRTKKAGTTGHELRLVWTVQGWRISGLRTTS